MKEYLLNTGRKPCCVNFSINGNGADVPLYIIGYDLLTPNTYFFKSKFLITGRENISLNCPQSPNFLKVIIWSTDDQMIDIQSVAKGPFTRQPVEEQWIDFIETFCRYEGIYWPGWYIRDGVPFEIELVREIYQENGEVHPTPARIEVDTPIIQVSKIKFDRMSIPQRIIILLHEVAHNFINYDQDSEQESDDNGLVIYQELGYPKIEAINAFANIMTDTDGNVQRMKNLINI